MSPNSLRSDCRKFAPNIFNKTKCSNCFKQKEEHTAEALECNRAMRKVAKSGYLFVAPGWDFSNPLNRTKRWQRRWFVLYDDGELNYSVDEHPDTVPQASIDMTQVLEVAGAEEVTGHAFSLAITAPDRVTFVKAMARDDARAWTSVLAVYTRNKGRHKRNATFPGGQTTTIHQTQATPRSGTPNPIRPRYNSCHSDSTLRAGARWGHDPAPVPASPLNTTTTTNTTSATTITTTRATGYRDQPASSASPPTRDKLNSEEKAAVRTRTRQQHAASASTASSNTAAASSTATTSSASTVPVGIDCVDYESSSKRLETLKDIAAVLTRPRAPSTSPSQQAPTRDSDTDVSPSVAPSVDSSAAPDLRVQLPAETLLHLKKGWLMLRHADSWTRLWFVLCGGALQAYKDPQAEDTAAEPELLVSLAQVKGVCEAQVQRNYGFQIRLWSDMVHTLSAVTSGIRGNWVLAVRRAAGLDELPPRPSSTPRSLLLSSDEEYRTASEGWAPASPPLARTPTSLVKQRSRSRSTPSTPSTSSTHSRASTLDSVSTDELLLLDWQNKFKEKDLILHETLEKYEHLNRDFASKQHANMSLQEELNCVNERLRRGIEENDFLYKKLQELEGKHNSLSFGSLSDLTNIDLDLDFASITRDSLIDEYNNLRFRFEKAVQEIRAMKRELRNSHLKYDDLELSNITLKQDLKKLEEDNQAQLAMMAARIQDLTIKLTASEKQVRNLKSKLQDSREKRRSLSLKGRESFSINKEVEDKITELEAKILSLETDKLNGTINKRLGKTTKKVIKRDRSSERASPVEDRSQRRLRRKSLDSATTSEPMKVLIRLSSLESKVTNICDAKSTARDENLLTSTESLNFSNQELKPVSESESNSRILSLESTIEAAKQKLSDCVDQISVLKNARRQLSPLEERLAPLEQTLTEAGNILKSCNNVSPAEVDVISDSVLSLVKSFEKLLSDKLTELCKKRRALRDAGQLTAQSSAAILAEKLAYESVLISRIHEALNTVHSEESRFSSRILRREVLETGQLAQQLHAKLTGAQPPVLARSRLSEEHLTRVLTRTLIQVGFLTNNNRQASLQEQHKQRDVQCGLQHLLAQQRDIDALVQRYKAAKLEQLAHSLAPDSEGVHVKDMCRMAHDQIGTELIEAEVAHVMARLGEAYGVNVCAGQDAFLSVWAAERAALELWGDVAAARLATELECTGAELRGAVRAKQPWRRRVELERAAQGGAGTRQLLAELADVLAHKALVDARVAVLTGDDAPLRPAKDGAEPGADSALVRSLVDSEQYLWLLEDAGVLEPTPLLAAEFQAVFARCQAELQQRLPAVPCMQCQHLKDSLHRLNVSHEASVAVHESAQAQLRERARVLEQRLGTLDSEYSRQLEQLRSAYRDTLTTPLPSPATSPVADPDSGGLRARYQAEIEQLRALCEKGLAAVESSHRRVVAELQDAHRREREQLRLEKEQALAEETQATLAALDAMRKAHEHEVRREVGKFKADFLRTLQATHDLGALHQEHEAEMREIKAEILALSERYSVKCVESASLEEQLCAVHQQLAHAHHRIQQLETRNKQLAESLAAVAAAADEPYHRQDRVPRRANSGMDGCKPKISTIRNPQLSPMQN